MEEKNKKMIIIVTSLLLVVGVSLAYFTASTIFGGNGTTVTGSTTAPQGSELIVEGTLEFNDLDIYPGHQNVSSIKVTATGDNELIPYNIIFNGINTLNTPLNYTVYKTSGSIDVSASCEKKSEVMGGAKIYYEECSISNIESLGSPVSSGTIESSEENSKTTLVKDEFITSSPTTEEVYYYVVLEYPNLEESQNIDMGGTFTGEVTIEISDVEPDINIIAAYIEQEDGSYEQVSDIPQSGYTLDTEKSTCSNGAIPTGNTPNITINNLSKSGTSCYLYFKIYEPTAKEIILSNYDTVLTRNDFSQTVTATTTGTIYKSLDESQYDNDGEVYYFAGNPTDNWVQFGGYYWRIIRINGNGSIRMIYQGDSANTTGEGMQITVDGTDTGAFNSSNNNNMYVGYMYGSGVHGLSSNSTIKGVLDQWYQDNLSSVSDKIDGKAGFCGDREPSTSESSSNGDGGTGTTTTYYGAYIRLITNKAPTFECQNESDLYTDSGSENGNKALTYPIGLISADEVAYAGGIYGTNNTNFYLYTGQVYWTMSPYNFNGSYAYEFSMNVLGGLGNTGMTNMRGIRPVINLKADVTITGSGTTTDPYKVEGV